MYRLHFLPIFLPILLSGCAYQPTYVPLPPSHPANPGAAESSAYAATGTLAVRSDSIVPPHPDWQIPGMRVDEKHGHADGPMPMGMQHGGMQHGGMSHGKGGHKTPGMVKMEAPPDVVDYAPAASERHGAAPGAPKEHKPELHLDHTAPARRDAQPQQAPIAPAEMEHGEHGGHAPSPAQKRVQSKPETSEHEGHTMQNAPTVQPAPPANATPAPANEHQNH